MSNTPDLKPCPFCGSMAWISVYEFEDGSNEWRIHCWHDDDCFLQNYAQLGFETEKEAILAWERRAER